MYHPIYFSAFSYYTVLRSKRPKHAENPPIMISLMATQQETTIICLPFREEKNSVRRSGIAQCRVFPETFPVRPAITGHSTEKITRSVIRAVFWVSVWGSLRSNLLVIFTKDSQYLSGGEMLLPGFTAVHNLPPLWMVLFDSVLFCVVLLFFCVLFGFFYFLLLIL